MKCGINQNWNGENKFVFVKYESQGNVHDVTEKPVHFWSELVTVYKVYTGEQTTVL
jgi:hypothetical protein